MRGVSYFSTLSQPEISYLFKSMAVPLKSLERSCRRNLMSCAKSQDFWLHFLSLPIRLKSLEERGVAVSSIKMKNDYRFG